MPWRKTPILHLFCLFSFAEPLLLKPLPNTTPTHSQNTPNAPKDGYLDKNIGVIKKDNDGDDRHSKNGMRTLKKLSRNFQHPST